MKKVAIITINSINFGNRLQNYALQKVIDSLGYKAYTIKREHIPWNKKNIIEYMKDFARTLLGTRKGLYIRFNINNICFSRHYALVNKVENNLKKYYDFFVTGSDQVWNPHYGHIVGQSDLLYFADNNQKISYAASFGVEDIPDNQREKYRNALKDFKAISVREKAGEKLVYQLTGRKAIVTLDPTLLLDVEQWSNIAKRPRYVPSGKYILIYTLGPKTKLFNDYVKNEFRHKGIEIYDVLKSNINNREPAVGPAEFIYLINHAEVVLTDSFHATVFSIMFHIPVRTFPRNGIDMSSRIVSLAALLGLEKNFTNVGVFFSDSDTDYEKIEKHLNKEREKSIDFLKNALTI